MRVAAPKAHRYISPELFHSSQYEWLLTEVREPQLYYFKPSLKKIEDLSPRSDRTATPSNLFPAFACQNLHRCFIDS